MTCVLDSPVVITGDDLEVGVITADCSGGVYDLRFPAIVNTTDDDNEDDEELDIEEFDDDDFDDCGPLIGEFDPVYISDDDHMFEQVHLPTVTGKRPDRRAERVKPNPTDSDDEADDGIDRWYL